MVQTIWRRAQTSLWNWLLYKPLVSALYWYVWKKRKKSRKCFDFCSDRFWSDLRSRSVIDRIRFFERNSSLDFGIEYGSTIVDVRRRSRLDPTTNSHRSLSVVARWWEVALNRLLLLRARNLLTHVEGWGLRSVTHLDVDFLHDAVVRIWVDRIWRHGVVILVVVARWLGHPETGNETFGQFVGNVSELGKAELTTWWLT